MSYSTPSCRPLTSPIWQFFHHDPKDKGYAFCNICKHRLSCRTTSNNLKKHLQNRHPTVSIETCFLKEKPQNKAHSNEDEPPPKVARVSSATATKLQQFSHSHASNSNVEVETDILQENPTPSTSGASNDRVREVTSSPLPHSNLNISHKTGQSLQQKISNYVPKKLTMTQKTKIDKAFVQLFTDDFQPFRIVEDKGFVAFTNALNPSYILPSRKTISKAIIPAKYEECLTDVQSKISEADSVCLTTDGWQSIATESFVAVTAHFIDCNFELRSVLLECEHFPINHTSKNLADYLRKVMDSWGITNKVIFVISDNASNICGALSLLNVMSMGCFAHSLNLVVKDGLKSNETISALLVKIRTIVAHFKRSAKSTNKLLDYQKKNNGPNELPKKLLLDVQTRWNSTYFMINRFVTVQESIKATVALLDKDLPTLGQHEWKMLAELTLCLKPFYSTTKSVSGEKYATGSLAIPLTTSLISVCEKLKKKDFTPEVKELVKSLSDNVLDRLSIYETSEMLTLVTFIDPRFKNLCYRSTSVVESTKQRVVNMVSARMRNEETFNKTEQQEVPNDNPSKKADEFSVLSSLDEILSKKVKKGTYLSRAIIEVDRYLEEDNLDMKKDPISYWKAQGTQFPFLRMIAKKYMCCLSTSVPCERIFSKAGLLISERRSRLSPNKAKMVMFLNQNMTKKREPNQLSEESDSE